MACGQAKPNINKNGRQPPALKDQGKHPQRISKRLQAIGSRKQSTSKSKLVQEIQILPSPPHTSSIPIDSKILYKSLKPHQKRKRGHEARHSSPQDKDRPPAKRRRTSFSNYPAEENLYKEAASDTRESSTDPLQYWVQNGRWCKEYFEQDSQVREDFERGKSLEEFEQRDILSLVQGQDGDTSPKTKSVELVLDDADIYLGPTSATAATTLPVPERPFGQVIQYTLKDRSKRRELFQR